MASSGGSITLFCISLILIAVLVLLLLRHYLPLRSTPAYLLIPVFLALALPSSIILLVPIDLASSAIEEDGVPRGIWLPSGAMLVVWRIAYWLTFALTWFMLPFLGEYSDSGHREPRDRIIYSLRTNAKYQLITLTCGVAGLIYIFVTSGIGGTSVKGLVMALAYAWGLVLAIYLMGHGLVALPRRLFRGASVSGRLRQIHTQAPKVHDRMQESMDTLEQYEATVRSLQRTRKPGTTRDLATWIEELASTADAPQTRIGSLAASSDALAIPAVITERYIADLARKLKRARHSRIRFIEEWDRLVRDADDLQAILDAGNSKRLTFGAPSPADSFLSKTTFLTPVTRYCLHATIIPFFRLSLSLFLALASLGVIASELTKAASPRWSLISLTTVHHPNATDRGKIGFAGQVIAGAWLCYMCAAALTSIREVKIWGNRALVTRNTYPESATWYATQVAKLTVPLSYNFITMLPRDIHDATTFYQFLGRLIDLTPLGTGFSRFFPIFVLVPVCATAFGLYGKVQRIAGFGVLAGDDDDADTNPSGYGTGGWREGKALIDRERLGAAGSGIAGASTPLGLASRDHSPHLRTERPAAPTQRYSDYPDVDDNSIAATSRGPQPTTLAAERQRRERQARTVGSPLLQEEDSGNWWSDFTHRVQNTFDAADKPDFNLNFKKPKWMGGGDGDGGAAGGSSTGGGNPFNRLFGGGNGTGSGGGGMRL
ncbi:hypothetical protein FH972_022636 [Carpinus fangiana]|uniref:Uncharacterized protein n=1 Tax=Carpinus fangiana TaxID=176857 RepID=A0A5N6KT51_9ROSI|nr:hypothetical protein FH972_022636 [Carpinus fangiana]